jgi:hypothetical protein
MNASHRTPIAPARAGAIGVFALVAGTALAGCSPAALTELPDGVTVAIQQNRDDYGPRRLEIVVDNGGSQSITVTRAVFESSGFVAPASWDRPAEIVAAPPPTCGCSCPMPTAMRGRVGRHPCVSTSSALTAAPEAPA